MEIEKRKEMEIEMRVRCCAYEREGHEALSKSKAE